MKYIFYFILLVGQTCYSQGLNQADMGSSAVLIQAGNNSGSGFYVYDSLRNNLFLVTASHVLIDPQKNLPHSDSIFLISYRQNSQKDERDTLRVSIYSAYQSGMLRYQILKDVAVLKFALLRERGISYLPFVTKTTKSNTYLNPFEIHLSKKINELETISDIYTIGYPKSLSLNANFDFNRPLVRKGIIAGIDLQKLKIVADLPVYKGNSGGAVFQKALNNSYIYLIGMVSQFVPFEERWVNQAYGYYNLNVYNSGYSILVPMDDIIKEINELK